MNAIPQLVCTAGPLQGHRANVTEAGLRLGRDPSCEIHIQDPDVSRSHARVILHNSAVWVQDAGSRNGVFVNDKRVVDNKSIGPGDRVSIGPHHFVLELLDVQADDPSVSVRLDSLEEPERRFKLWPFALVLVILVGGIGLISMAGQDGPSVQDQVDPGAYSLTAALKPQETEGAGGTTPARDPEAGDPRDAWPDPPEGATLTELVEQGHAAYQAGRLQDALAQYQMALKLDESCEICEARIPRIEGEIAAQVKENFDSGLRYYNSLKYREAINAWETVLLLEPDPTAPIHKQTVEYLAQAREKQAGQF
ncbi:MAG: FHA domain-containing protein [Myxococcota bacterium]|nr:FHA domain-containing protein [Myxococcota bacterium]